MKNLNTASKVILLIGLLAFAVSGMWVPWTFGGMFLDDTRYLPPSPLGYGPIWHPPEGPFQAQGPIRLTNTLVGRHGDIQRQEVTQLHREDGNVLVLSQVESTGVSVNTGRLFIQW